MQRDCDIEVGRGRNIYMRDRDIDVRCMNINVPHRYIDVQRNVRVDRWRNIYMPHRNIEVGWWRNIYMPHRDIDVQRNVRVDRWRNIYMPGRDINVGHRNIYMRD